MMSRFFSLLTLSLCFAVASLSHATEAGEEISQAIATIQKVGPEGEGNAEAAEAWQTLSSATPAALITMLQAMEEASPLAKNWILSAADTVFANAESDSSVSIPVDQLGLFLLQTRHGPEARATAYDFLQRARPDVSRELVAFQAWRFGADKFAH